MEEEPSHARENHAGGFPQELSEDDQARARRNRLPMFDRASNLRKSPDGFVVAFVSAGEDRFHLFVNGSDLFAAQCRRFLLETPSPRILRVREPKGKISIQPPVYMISKNGIMFHPVIPNTYEGLFTGEQRKRVVTRQFWYSYEGLSSPVNVFKDTVTRLPAWTNIAAHVVDQWEHIPPAHVEEENSPGDYEGILLGSGSADCEGGVDSRVRWEKHVDIHSIVQANEHSVFPDAVTVTPASMALVLDLGVNRYLEKEEVVRYREVLGAPRCMAIRTDEPAVVHSWAATNDGFGRSVYPFVADHVEWDRGEPSLVRVSLFPLAESVFSEFGKSSSERKDKHKEVPIYGVRNIVEHFVHPSDVVSVHQIDVLVSMIAPIHPEDRERPVYGVFATMTKENQRDGEDRWIIEGLHCISVEETLRGEIQENDIMREAQTLHDTPFYKKMIDGDRLIVVRLRGDHVGTEPHIKYMSAYEIHRTFPVYVYRDPTNACEDMRSCIGSTRCFIPSCVGEHEQKLFSRANKMLPDWNELQDRSQTLSAAYGYPIASFIAPGSLRTILEIGFSSGMLNSSTAAVPMCSISKPDQFRKTARLSLENDEEKKILDDLDKSSHVLTVTLRGTVPVQSILKYMERRLYSL